MQAALTAGQRHAEALMVDACRITRSILGALDEATGRYTGAVTEIYRGRCRLQIRTTSVGADVSVAGVTTGVDLIEVHVPLPATTGVLPGDLVEVVESRDPAAVGRRMAVMSVPTKTDATARRLLCEDTRT